MATSDYKRSIGTGAMRSTSGANVLLLRSGTNLSPPASPLEPFGFGEGPYVHASSRAMHDLTKTALGTASLGRSYNTKQKGVADTFEWANMAPGRPRMQRNATDTHPAKRWRVDDRGWLVGSKPDSSPKVMKAAQAGALPGTQQETSSRPTNNVPRKVDWSKELTVGTPSHGVFATYESPKLARGRVLGLKQQYIPSTAINMGGPHDDDDSSRWMSPADKFTDAQVEAYKHYENKARHNSLREYKDGIAPRRLSSQEEKVAVAGWEARKTRQLSKIDRLCDELYEAYSTGQRPGCGAEDAQNEQSTSGDLLLSMRPLEKDLHLEPQKLMSLPYPATGYSVPSSPSKEQHYPMQRPPLAIYRKPVSSKTTARLAQQSGTHIHPPAGSMNIHARASSSPAIHPQLFPLSSGNFAAQLRSNSSSPPKRSIGTKPSLQGSAGLGWKLEGRTLPCAFPQPASPVVLHNIEDPCALNTVCRVPVARQWDADTGTVKRRRPANAGLTKWTKLETVPLPLTFTVPQASSLPQTSSKTSSMADFDINEPSLEGPELLYSPLSSHHQQGELTLELHPRVKLILSHAYSLGVKALNQRGWLVWGAKVGVLCWVAVILWTLLDAVREGLRRVLWPANVVWDFIVWVMSGQ